MWECVNAGTEVYLVDNEEITTTLLGLPEDGCGEELAPVTVTAYDDCSESGVEVTYTEWSEADTECGTVWKRRWSATDGCGNTTVEERSVYELDETAPVLVFAHPMLSGIEDGGVVRLQIGGANGTLWSPYYFWCNGC
ncbi:MAG: hypothetical protein R2795_09425 [Saprospiraceae bacterium]